MLCEYQLGQVLTGTNIPNIRTKITLGLGMLVNTAPGDYFRIVSVALKLLEQSRRLI